MEDLMIVLFEQHIQTYPYFGRVQWSAYKHLVQNPTLEVFKKLQQWELNPENKKVIEELKLKNQPRMKELMDKDDISFKKWRSELQLKIPSIESITMPIRMFPKI